MFTYDYKNLVDAPDGCNQYCINITTDGTIKAAFQARDDEPTQVIPEVTGSYTLVFPAPSLAEATAHAAEVLAGYLED